MIEPIYRYLIIETRNPMPKYRIALMCKNGIRVAKYKLIEISSLYDYLNINSFIKCVYKLDKRSIRYAEGINFIENMVPLSC